MQGTNPIRKPVLGNGQTLEVQEIFATVQGEGPRAGEPAVFIRFGGCNLACTFCDTEFEGFKKWAVTDILIAVRSLADDGRKLAVLTGGEPFRQPVELLCMRLLEEGFAVQIETNGTLFRPVDERVEIVCSPKNVGKGYLPLRQDLLMRLTALKFLISNFNPMYSTVGEVGQGDYRIPVFVQPMDEYDPIKNAANQSRALSLAQTHGYRVSMQLHKIFGIP